MSMTSDGRIRDDTKGGWLDGVKVQKARMDEIKYVRSRGVYERVPWSQAMRRTGKPPIKLRWVDTNKGTEDEPNYRSKIAAMEFKRDNRLDLYVPTPPLGATKLVVSNAASDGKHGKEKVIMAIDVKRLYFYAKPIRETYVELPRGDDRLGDEDQCGLLKLSLYGTRDAAMNWGHEINETMVQLGFINGTRRSACISM